MFVSLQDTLLVAEDPKCLQADSEDASDWLCCGLTTRQPLWVILCRLPEKGRKEKEEIVEEMKERNGEERETGMKVKKQKK